MLETRASKVVLLVDSSKFRAPAGQVVCGLEAITTLITDDGLSEAEARMVRRAGTKLIVVKGM